MSHNGKRGGQVMYPLSFNLTRLLNTYWMTTMGWVVFCEVNIKSETYMSDVRCRVDSTICFVCPVVVKEGGIINSLCLRCLSFSLGRDD